MVWFALGIPLLGRRRGAPRSRRLARGVDISPLVVGLTVVAYGTSSPELAVSVRSAVAGQADIALGNVVGSNIFNVLLPRTSSSLRRRMTPCPRSGPVMAWFVMPLTAVTVAVIAWRQSGARHT